LLTAILIGFLFGFIGSMPVAGPIAALVLARGLSSRFRAGIAIAIGAALAESTYAFLAFWGFSQILTRYPIILPISRAAAAVILMGLGTFLTWRPPSPSPSPTDEPVRERLSGSFLLGFTITALNPTLIATWTAAAATLASTGLIVLSPDLAVPFSLAACVGIIVWFWILLWLVRRYRDRFRPKTLGKVIQVIGVALVALGLWFAVLFVQWLV
jgi:threonine/homoserine/homoserine lactone efflux protein